VDRKTTLPACQTACERPHLSPPFAENKTEIHWLVEKHPNPEMAAGGQ